MFLICFGHTSSSESLRQYPTVIEELCRPFSLADLRKSTNNFDENRVIGYEGFCRVYKGCIQHNDASDCTVAVRRWNKLGSLLEEFKNEIELLCQLRHPNIVSLIGFCNHKKEKILVYEYMSNGSLCEWLQGGDREALSWKKRLEICIGVARALHYLHAGAKRTIIHRQMPFHNYLIRPTERELLKKPVEEIIDPNIKGNIEPQCWQVFVDIAQRCVKYEADERPTMGEVEVELEQTPSLQEQADITNTNAHYTLLSKTIINFVHVEV